MAKKTINILGVLCALFLFSYCSPEKKTYHTTHPSTKPNFVMIMADDLGYGDISSYGNTYIHTPNLDQLASEGIRFTDFHSNGTVCSPTRAALMTGKYQQRTGVGGVITAASHRHVGLSIDETIIADELKMYGYNSGIFGKWHLGYAPEFNPRFQGFDKFVGFVSGNVDYHSHIDQEGFLDWWKDTIIHDEKGYTTDLITNYGIKFIRESQPKKTGKSFFLYLPHESPHYPYQRRVDSIQREIGIKGTASLPADSTLVVYKEMVEVMDEGIGMIMQTLKETGMDSNTIVLFFSDNGASKHGDNGILRGTKGTVYEGGHRVPAIAWYPGKFRAGTTTEELVMTMDLLPTILDFIGAKPSNENIDGVSIKNLLLTGEQIPDRDLFWSFKNAHAIRSDGWKLISTVEKQEEKIELFNLSNDISEKNNLTEQNPEVVSQLKQKLELWKHEVGKGVTIVSN